MRHLTVYLFPFLLLAFSGCADRPEPELDTAKATTTGAVIVGEVYYRERITLPEGARLVVTLEDVSRMDVASLALAEHSIELTASQPHGFKLIYDPAQIDSRMRYSLRARILVDGRLLFISTEAIDPFSKPLRILVSKVGSTVTSGQSVAKDTADFVDEPTIVSVNPLATIEGTYWKLLSVGGREIIMDEKQEREASFQLRAGSGQAKGFGGCNSFSGAYSLNGNELLFMPLAATMRACVSGMKTELAFFAVLESTAYFSINEESLTLFSENKEPIAQFAAIYF